MSENNEKAAPNGDATAIPESQLLDEVDAIARKSLWRSLRNVGIAILCLLALVGAITTAIGIGPFGYKWFTYGDNLFFVYNGTKHFALLDIDGTEYELEPYSGQTLDLIGGDFQIVTRLRLVKIDEETKRPYESDEVIELERHDLVMNHRNWFYHIADETSSCTAITDVSAYYNDATGDAPEIVQMVPKNNRLFILDAVELIYPQAILPDKGEPPVYFLGVIACALVDHPDEAVANVRFYIEEMRKKLENARKHAKPAL